MNINNNSNELAMAKAIAAQLVTQIAFSLSSEDVEKWTKAREAKRAAEKEMRKLQADATHEFLHRI